MEITKTDAVAPQLILNILESDEQYEGIVNPSDTEIYLTPDNVEEELAKKQDKLVAGTNINLVDNADGTTTISSTASESFYKGTYENWSLVPTNGDAYPDTPRGSGNHKPTYTDYIIIQDASTVPGGQVDISMTMETDAYTSHPNKKLETIIDGNVYNGTGTFYDGNIQVYTDAAGGNYSVHWKTLKNPVEYQGQTYQPGSDFLTIIINPSNNGTRNAQLSLGNPYEGTWRFSYDGVWDNDNRNGWKGEYKVEDTLPDATDQVKGIAKLYNTTGSNTDGSMTQKSITDALDSKLDKTSEIEKVYGTDGNDNQVVYSAGNNIEFYNKSPQVFSGEEGKTYTEVNSLKSEDGQYIDTKLRYNSNQKGPTYDITFRYISIEGGSFYNGAVFGARAITGYWGIGIDSFGGKLRIIHGGDNIYNVIDKNTDTNWHRVYSTYDLNADGGTTYYYYDDELVFQTTKQFTTSDLTMVVFGKRSEDSVSVDSPIEIASFKWYDDSGNALLDYVPAVSSTGEAGFYDKVSEEFKVSATGTSPEVVPFVEEHKINAIEPVVFRRIIEE